MIFFWRFGIQMIITIDNKDWTRKDIGIAILRTYENAEISTSRTYELLENLFNGQKIWDSKAIWKRV